VIAHCPACGTHYRHDVLATPMRGRCGRCDTAIDLSRLRPYRLVVRHVADAVALAASGGAVRETFVPAHAPPPVAVAPEPAPSVPLQASSPSLGERSWENEDPLPPIPEMAITDIDLRPVPADREDQAGSPEGAAVGPESAVPTASSGGEGRGTTWLLWVAAGAIAGTGISWTIGGTTLAGVAAGTLAGAIAGWGWLRWMSPR